MHERAFGKRRLEFRHRDEFALGQFQDKAAAVDVDEVVRAGLGDDIAGAIATIGVEDLGGDIRPAVVTGDQGLGGDHQLAARVRPVGVEITEFRDVDEPVAGYGRAAHSAVHGDTAGFGGAVPVHQMQVEQIFDPVPQLCRNRCGTGDRCQETPPEQRPAQLGPHLFLDRGLLCAGGEPALGFAAEPLVQQFPDSGYEGQLGGPDQGQVLQQSRQVTLGGEKHGAAPAECHEKDGPPHDVAHRHETEHDRRFRDALAPSFAGGCPPVVGLQPVGDHGPFGGAGAAGGVDQQCRPVRVVAGRGGQRWLRVPAVDHVGQGFDDHRAARRRQFPGRGLERRTLVVGA